MNDIWNHRWKSLGTFVRIDLAERVKTTAEQSGMTRAAWIREAITEKLEKETV